MCLGVVCCCPCLWLRISHWLSCPVYEGRLDKRFMNFVALQPLVVDEAFMPHMKAIDVPFHLLPQVAE